MLPRPLCLHRLRILSGTHQLVYSRGAFVQTLNHQIRKVCVVTPASFIQFSNTDTKNRSNMGSTAENKPAEGLNGSPVKVNNWKVPGSAAFNFRSDTTTTPTESMLQSITYTTLLDDVTRHDSTTNNLQSWIAKLLGHEAGLLTSSGTMGNQLAARSHLERPPYSVIADASSHLLIYEAGGLSSNSGAFPIAAHRSKGRPYLTLEDIQAVAVLGDDVHGAPTKLIALENTIDGVGVPLEECARICTWARDHGIKTHLDGARLWEVVAANVSRNSTASTTGTGSKGMENGNGNGHDLTAALEKELLAYATLFDSVTVCFSKGLGAPIGSMLVGTADFIKQARHVRKSWGGGMRQTGIFAAPARVAVEETFFGGQLVRSHEVAQRIAKMWTDKGGKLLVPVDTNMVWIDLKQGVREKIWMAEAEREGLIVYGGSRGRIVVHYQISEEAIRRLDRVFEKVISGEGSTESTTLNGFQGYQANPHKTGSAGDGDEA